MSPFKFTKPNAHAAKKWLRRLSWLPVPNRIHVPACALCLALALALTSCSRRDAKVVEVTAIDGKINLAAELPGRWQRVCILMPYATADQAKKTLGFSYVPEAHSSIYSRDDRSLLVTVADGEALGSYEILRSNADFTQVGTSCFSREQAVFEYRQSEDGWNEVRAT